MTAAAETADTARSPSGRRGRPRIRPNLSAPRARARWALSGPSGLFSARASDYVLIPCRPSAADLATIGASTDLARVAEKPAAAVVNAAPVANPLTGQALAAVSGYAIEACREAASLG